jgi:hypothetical protein
MIETHAIRLRGPWECQLENGEVRRVHLPASLRQALAGASRGRLTCRRRFGCPTCLDPHERVWLVVELPRFAGHVDLNGEQVGHMRRSEDVVEIDVTSRLAERNQLAIVFQLGETGDGTQSAADDLLFAEVRLEIRG